MVKNRASNLASRQAGFSLFEVIIALMVFIVMMIVAVDLVKNQYEYDHLVENQRYMTEVRDGFMTFVKVNRFLPCPDTDNDGKENRNNAPNFECTLEEGKVPFLDLGVPARDAWNQPLFYAVNNQADEGASITNPLNAASYFNNQAAPVFRLNTPPIGISSKAGNYRVCGEETSVITGCSSGTPSKELLEAVAIAVIVSFGENGSATWDAIYGVGGVTLTLDDAETENMNGDQNYWQAVGSKREGQRFDDKLFWLLDTDIKYAIISSGGSL